jgi:hypothetical protein
MSTFAFAGVSTLNGVTKIRFANDQMRIKILAKNGHKDIDVVQLKEPMTKADIVAYLIKIDFANGNKAVQAALEAAAEKRGLIEKPKKERKTKAKKEVAAPAVETAPAATEEVVA